MARSYLMQGSWLYFLSFHIFSGGLQLGGAASLWAACLRTLCFQIKLTAFENSHVARSGRKLIREACPS